MQYVSHSSYLVSIEAITRLIYIYETIVKQIFASDCSKSYPRAQKTKNFSGGHAPRPPWRCREQLIKRNPKCCPSTFHNLPIPLIMAQPSPLTADFVVHVVLEIQWNLS